MQKVTDQLTQHGHYKTQLIFISSSYNNSKGIQSLQRVQRHNCLSRDLPRPWSNIPPIRLFFSERAGQLLLIPGKSASQSLLSKSFRLWKADCKPSTPTPKYPRLASYRGCFIDNIYFTSLLSPSP